jgi:hypothetical protein
MDAAAKYAKIVAVLRRSPGVTVGAAKRGFGSSALCVGGKIFAMVSSQGCFVVKLPRKRVDELLASGVGVRFEPGPGRVMKEWLAVDPAADADWLALAREARTFVGGSKPKGLSPR